MLRWTALLLGMVAAGCQDGGARREGGPGPDVSVPTPDVETSVDAARDVGGPGDAGPGDAGPGDAGLPNDAGTEDGGLPARPLPAPPAPRDVEGRLTMTSGACAQCHANAGGADAMRDAARRPIAPYDLWQATMMANAARDPLWRAVVSAEVAATPAAGAAIEAKCARCHTPAAHAEAPGVALSTVLGEASVRGELARDGVTCTVCHQITPEGLGLEASFTGGYVIGQDARIYGPHADPFTQPMRMHTGYTATESQHILDSSLCGSCHTLITDALDPEGTPTGHRLFEQATFLEWRASGHAEAGTTCQTCHTPTRDVDGVPIRTAIAHAPNGGDFGQIDPRDPYGRHLFVGGNTLVPALLRDHPESLATRAPRAAFDAVIREARAQLQRSARLEVVAVAGGIDVRVLNEAGHKLPSGFPSRRAWLHVVARDGAGRVVFESGASDAQGRLVDGHGQVQPEERRGGPVRGPTLAVSRPEEVAVFESLMCDPDEQPTWTLLRGSHFCHDTRLLPTGWQARHPDGPATAPVGVEVGPRFEGGSATVRYALPASARQVEVGLDYQVLGARFAAELLAVDTAEVAALRFYLAQADRRAERLVTAAIEL